MHGYHCKADDHQSCLLSTSKHLFNVFRYLSLYSQTFENRSSLPPPNPPPPPAGLLCTGAGGLVAAGVTGAALLHPPKSSSGATLGGACEELPKPFPPNAEDWVFEGADVPPQAEKSLDIGMEGALAGAAVLGFGAVVVAVGSEVAHASLDPQASMLEKPDDAEGGAGWAGGADLAAG